jgi:superfamily I DNA and/or RNA helicase
MVASLDSFQGQERSIIIYSCTRSNTIPPEKSRIGFLRELRRLNVALSRPLKQFVFIGDIDFLAGCRNADDKSSELDFSRFILLMKKHAQQNGEFTTAGDLLRRMEEN